MAEPSPEMPLTSVPSAEPGIWPKDWKLAVWEAAAPGLAKAGPGLPAASAIASTPAGASMPIARTACLVGCVIMTPVALAGAGRERALPAGEVAYGPATPLRYGG